MLSCKIIYGYFMKHHLFITNVYYMRFNLRQLNCWTMMVIHSIVFPFFAIHLGNWRVFPGSRVKAFPVSSIYLQFSKQHWQCFSTFLVQKLALWHSRKNLPHLSTLEWFPCNLFSNLSPGKSPQNDCSTNSEWPKGYNITHAPWWQSGNY